MVVHSATEYRLNKTLLLRPEVLEMRINFHTTQISTFKRLVPNQVAKWAT
jgi:dynactin-6